MAFQEWASGAVGPLYIYTMHVAQRYSRILRPQGYTSLEAPAGIEVGL